MSELANRVLKLIPQYLDELLEATLGPKRFLVSRNLDDPRLLTKSIEFFLLSLLGAFGLQLPLLAVKDHALYTLITLVLVEAVLMLIGVMTLRFCWFLVGGKAGMRNLLIYLLYSVGPSMIIMVVFSLIGNSLYRLFDPEGYQISKAVTVSFSHGQLDLMAAKIKTFNIERILLLTGFLFIYLRLLVSWDAFRQINQVSKWRSVTALTVLHFFTPMNFTIGILLGMLVWLPNPNFPGG